MDILVDKQTNKQNHNNPLSKELQKLKIELNDKLFQINKLQQDYAQEKAKYFMDFQKERLNLNKTIKELKDKNQFENEQWSKKIQEFREQTKHQIDNIRVQSSKSIEQQKQKIRQYYNQLYSSQMQSLKNQHEETKNNFTLAIHKITIQNQQKLNDLQEKHVQKCEKIQIQHRSQIDSIISQYEAKLVTVRKACASQAETKQLVMKQYQTYVQESVREKIKYCNQIDLIKSEKTQLKRQIQELKDEIKKIQIQQVESRRVYQRSISNLNELRQKDMKKMIDESRQKLQSQKQRYEKQMLNLKNEVRQMTMIFLEKQRKWQQRGEMVLKAVENNNKKYDTMKTIKHLQIELMKRDTLLQRQKQAVKNCRLQLQNMQQIYDKMFVSNNYLYKFRSKTFKVKKARVQNQLNNSNNSIFIQQRILTQGDK